MRAARNSLIKFNIHLTHRSIPLRRMPIIISLCLRFHTYSRLWIIAFSLFLPLAINNFQWMAPSLHENAIKRAIERASKQFSQLNENLAGRWGAERWRGGKETFTYIFAKYAIYSDQNSNYRHSNCEIYEIRQQQRQTKIFWVIFSANLVSPTLLVSLRCAQNFCRRRWKRQRTAAWIHSTAFIVVGIISIGPKSQKRLLLFSSALNTRHQSVRAWVCPRSREL